MVLDSQQMIRNILTQYFFEAQKRNSKFSLRAFSTKLGVSSSALSEIVRGKRKVSRKMAYSFADKLGIEGKKRKQLIDAFENSKSLEKLKPMQNPLKEIVISPDKFHIMADRIFFSVLGMARAKNATAERIAGKLNLSVQSVQKALDELVEVGVLRKELEEYKEIERVIFRTSVDFPEALIGKRRLQNNEAAKNAISSNVEGQWGMFATVGVDREKLREAAPIVEDFIKRFCLFVRKPESEDIFEINLDIFPWSKI